MEKNEQSFQLLDVHVEHLLISGDEAFRDDPTSPDSISIGHEIQWAFRFEEEELALRLFVYVDGTNKEGEEIGVKLEIGVACYFSVEFLSDYVIHNEVEEGKKEYQVNPVLGKELLNHAYPMIRGITLERSRGSLMGPIILPFQELDHLLEA